MVESGVALRALGPAAATAMGMGAAASAASALLLPRLAPAAASAVLSRLAPAAVPSSLLVRDGGTRCRSMHRNAASIQGTAAAKTKAGCRLGDNPLHA